MIRKDLRGHFWMFGSILSHIAIYARTSDARSEVYGGSGRPLLLGSVAGAKQGGHPETVWDFGGNSSQ